MPLFMAINTLRITGPEGEAYRLGEPISIYDGLLFLGTVDVVQLRNAGTEVHLESFVPARVVREEDRHVGRLIFLEVFAMLCDRFHQVQAISFSFSLPNDHLSMPEQQPAARAAMLARIGVVNIQVVPRSPGQRVSGTWGYGARNLAALHHALAEQWEVFRDRPIGAEPARRGVLANALCRIFQRRR